MDPQNLIDVVSIIENARFKVWFQRVRIPKGYSWRYGGTDIGRSQALSNPLNPNNLANKLFEELIDYAEFPSEKNWKAYESSNWSSGLTRHAKTGHEVIQEKLKVKEFVDGLQEGEFKKQFLHYLKVRKWKL